VPRDTPICIVSHIPIVSIAAFFSGATGKEELIKDGSWVLSGSWVHVDAKAFKELFARHPNVKLCLSGHLHLQDRVDYNGASYLCNGAVCGAWWKGPLRECHEGYTMLDLFSDGSFEHKYMDYGWSAAT
jgi:3',5'-cyclic-AMP phosphodiesterase